MNSIYNSIKANKICSKKFNKGGEGLTQENLKKCRKKLRTQINGKTFCGHGLEQLI